MSPLSPRPGQGWSSGGIGCPHVVDHGPSGSALGLRRLQPVGAGKRISERAEIAVDALNASVGTWRTRRQASCSTHDRAASAQPRRLPDDHAFPVPLDVLLIDPRIVCFTGITVRKT